MSVQALSLYCDNSTLTNFSAWASAISTWYATVGWKQTTDTGQVMWTGMSLSACSASSGVSTYTYGSLTGASLVTNRTVTITGMTNSANNGTFNITGFTGSTSGTFTVNNASGVSETGSSGVVTKISAVPGSGAVVYDYWVPNDGLTPSFVVRMGYGNFSGQTNMPLITVITGDSTNGAGLFVGNTVGGNNLQNASYTVPNSVPYDCRFSGGSSYIAVTMWRNAPNSAPCFFGLERSRNSSGTATNAYVTQCGSGWGSNAQPYYQQTLILGGPQVAGTGEPPSVSYDSGRAVQGGMALSIPGAGNTGTNYAFNGNVGVATTSPYVGYWDYPLTICGMAPWLNFNEGQTITVTLYGSTRTYFLTSGGSGLSGTPTLMRSGPGYQTGWFMMRYD